MSYMRSRRPLRDALQRSRDSLRVPSVRLPRLPAVRLPRLPAVTWPTPPRRVAGQASPRLDVRLDELLRSRPAPGAWEGVAGSSRQRAALGAAVASGLGLVVLMAGLFIALPSPELQAPDVAELGTPQRLLEAATDAERAVRTVQRAALSVVRA